MAVARAASRRWGVRVVLRAAEQAVGVGADEIWHCEWGLANGVDTGMEPPRGKPRGITELGFASMTAGGILPRSKLRRFEPSR